MLFNLGSAVVQPPTFTGNSGLGYAVTAGGNLVRFDLDNPSAGASVVYSGQQVVAAQALTSGQVVVALADGVVDLLVPQGNGLSVQSQLLADGATPSLPSSIDVVAKANGLFDVLVSSEGSDNLSVFSLGGAVSSGGSDAVRGRCVAAFVQRVPAPGCHAKPARRLDGERDRHECQPRRRPARALRPRRARVPCPRPPPRRWGYRWAVSPRSRAARRAEPAKPCLFRSRATPT